MTAVRQIKRQSELSHPPRPRQAADRAVAHIDHARKIEHLTATRSPFPRGAPSYRQWLAAGGPEATAEALAPIWGLSAEQMRPVHERYRVVAERRARS